MDTIRSHGERDIELATRAMDAMVALTAADASNQTRFGDETAYEGNIRSDSLSLNKANLRNAVFRGISVYIWFVEYVFKNCLIFVLTSPVNNFNDLLQPSFRCSRRMVPPAQGLPQRD